MNKKLEPLMKFRRIQKKMTDLIDADMSEAVDLMKGLEILKNQNQNQNMSTVVAALPTIQTQPFVVVISNVTLQSVLLGDSYYLFSEVIFLSFKTT